MQKVDLYQPMIASRPGHPPLALRIAVTPQTDMLVGGVPQATAKIEMYVLLSALPPELQQQIRTACQAILSGQ